MLIPIWPLPIDALDQLETTLSNDDRSTLHDRIERYEHICNKFGPTLDNWFWFEPMPLEKTFLSYIGSYIHGYLIANILLSQVIVERSLGYLLKVSKSTQSSTSDYRNLITKAFDNKIISKGLSDRLHQLRIIRNIYAHVDNGTEIFENEDEPIYHAKLALDIVSDYLTEVGTHFN